MTRFANKETLDDGDEDEDGTSDEDVRSSMPSIFALPCANELRLQDDDDAHNYSAGEEDAAGMEL